MFGQSFWCSFLERSSTNATFLFEEESNIYCRQRANYIVGNVCSWEAGILEWAQYMVCEGGGKLYWN